MTSVLDFFGLGDVQDPPSRGPDTAGSQNESSGSPAANSPATTDQSGSAFPQQSLKDWLVLLDPFSGGNLTQEELAAVQAKTAADIKSTGWAQTADPAAVQAAVDAANKAQAQATTVYTPTKLFAAGSLTLLAIVALAALYFFGGRR